MTRERFRGAIATDHEIRKRGGCLISDTDGRLIGVPAWIFESSPELVAMIAEYRDELRLILRSRGRT